MGRLKIIPTYNQIFSSRWFMLRYVIPFAFIVVAIIYPNPNDLEILWVSLVWLVLAFTPQIRGLIKKTMYNRSVFGQGIFLVVVGIIFIYLLFSRFIYFGLACLLIGLFFLYKSHKS